MHSRRGLRQDAHLTRDAIRHVPTWRAAAIVVLAAAVQVFATVAAAAERSHAVEGVVRYVIDGDTLVWQPGSKAVKPIKLRLRGIDAPEICQAGGVQARDALAQRVLRRRVQVTGEFEDDYRRRLVTVTVDGDDIGAWMVSQGHAWNARYRGQPGPYAREERAARAERRGLFAEAQPLPPRVFRRTHGSCYPQPAP